MTQSMYSNQMKALQIYIDALDAADKRIDEELGGVTMSVPYLANGIQVKIDGEPYGRLSDDGAGWFWSDDE